MITLKKVSFHYKDSDAGVCDIDFSIKDGECIVLAGPSGGGKTTLTRLLNGLAPAYYPGELTGQILFNGKESVNSKSYEIGREIGSVFQDPKSQFFSSELAGEVAFACENYGMHTDEIIKRTDMAIRRFDLNCFRGHSLDVLSSGEKQRVAIASVYALHPNVYVCDEPTANLDDKGSTHLADMLQKLKKEGNTLIIAEHRLAWLAQIADRYVYIANGRMCWEKTAKQLAEMSDTERDIFGLRIVDKIELGSIQASVENTSPVLSAHRLSLTQNKKIIFTNQNFLLFSGQITALTGENGAGKTSLAKVLTGLTRESSGEVQLFGKRSAPSHRRKIIWYGSNDTATQFFTNSVTEELLLQSKKTPEVLERARKLLKDLGLYKFREVHPASLSGGQKQRLSIACGILSQRRILIFDEPTSGLDGINMEIIASLLKDESRKGTAILVITHDKELIQRCCNFVINIDKQ